jgi:dihydroorotase
MTTSITIPSACDFHLHLRQGEMMRMVTPKVEEGGVSLAYIMVRHAHSYFKNVMPTHLL